MEILLKYAARVTTALGPRLVNIAGIALSETEIFCLNSFLIYRLSPVIWNL